MTPQEQNIAIAESCGWKWYAHGHHADAVPEHWERGEDAAWSVKQLSSYTTCINAMHEAEKVRICGNCDMEYREELGRACGQYAIIYHATAAQRAEAFLRTIGKWEEGK